MGKFVYAILLVFVVELALFLFQGTTYVNTPVFELLLNPNNLLSDVIYIALLLALGALGASVIIPGNFIQLNVYAIYAGLAIAFISFIASIAHLWTFVNDAIGGLEGVATVDATWISGLIVAPFIIFYLLAVTEWVRSNS